MSISTNEPLVVRFHVQDHERFKEYAGTFFDAMMREDDFHGAVVTAISREDVFEQLEAYEHDSDD